MSKITGIYTAISEILAPIAMQIYFTTIPADAVYPHIYVFVVSDKEDHHKDTNAGNTSIDTYRVQIECRAVDQETVSATKDEITDLLHSDTDMYARADVSGIPTEYDGAHRVYRGGRDYIIHYKPT